MIRRAFEKFLTWQAIQVGRSMRSPREAQERTFHRLTATLQGCEIARRSGFRQCRVLEDCRDLPVSSSESMMPHWQEVFAGGKARRQEIGRSELVGFARTSGTAGHPKDIPLNKAYLHALDRTLLRTIACRYHTTGGWDKLLSGKRLLLGSRPIFGQSPTSLPICDISGFIPTRTRRYLRPLYAPRHQDLWIQDWAEKVEKIIDQVGGADLLSIIGLPALAMDFARRACSRFGISHLSERWPNLRSFTYGGVHLSEGDKAEIRAAWFHREQPFHFVETYFATEGPLAYSFDPTVAGLTLNSLELLYLFREDDGVSGAGRLLFAHELEKGKRYAIHITTPGGLINYHMGDQIEVVEERPLLVRVAGREADEISMTGEKLTLEQCTLALLAAGIGEPGVGEDLPVVWVERAERPRLVWGIPDSLLRSIPAPPQALASQLDAALCRANVHYEEALNWENLLAPSRVVAVPSQVFESYRRSQLGRAQAKTRRLFNSLADFRDSYSWEPPGGSS